MRSFIWWQRPVVGSRRGDLRRGNSGFDDAGAVGARENEMFDVVAPDDEEALARTDHQRFDDREPARPCTAAKPANAEAAHAETGESPDQ